MGPHARITLAALLAALALLCAGPSAAGAASFGVQKGSFTAESRASGMGPFTQAAGHPAAIAAQFEMATEGPGGEPAGELAQATLALPSGLVLDPQSASQCEARSFEGSPEPQCPSESRVGSLELTLYVGGKDEQLSAAVYDLVQADGLAAELGVYLPADPPRAAQRLLLKGRISPNDYRERLQLEVPAGLVVAGLALKLEDSSAPELLTLPSACSSSMSWGLSLQARSGASESATSESAGVQGCEKVPVAASLQSTFQNTGSEQPDGVQVLASLPGGSSALAGERVVLPAGLTLNPAGLAGLQGCTPAQAALGAEAAPACPPGSQIGSASLSSPVVPEAIAGGVYLASEGEALTGGSGASAAQYPVYLELEDARYGVSLRLKGMLTAPRSEGALEVTLSDVPQLPLGEFELALGGGTSTLLANPLACGAGTLEVVLTPYTTLLATPALSKAFSTTGCPSDLPFAPTQSSSPSADAAAPTSYTVAFARPPADEYLARIRTVLPSGIVAHFPIVAPCAPAQAASADCPQSSEVGSASVEAGAGATPLTLGGQLYLTGPYDGAPFGLALEIPATAGSLHLGTILALVKLSLAPKSGELVLEGNLPQIVQGIPLRLRRVSLSFSRPGFLYGPTGCATGTVTSTLTGFIPGVSAQRTRNTSSRLKVSGCARLPFRPALAAASSAISATAASANIETTISTPRADANIRALLLELPRAFALRASTLAHACAEATFQANPYACPSAAFVGAASASTPMLAARLVGPAILVVHPQTNLPELDLVLEGEGVRLILSGSFRVVNHITFLDYGSEPDVPLASLRLGLPSGPRSALAFLPRAGVCPLPLRMPTVIEGWNGLEAKPSVPVTPLGCGVRIVGHKVIGDTAYLTVQTFAAGRISGSGRDLALAYRRLASPQRAVALRVSLSRHARASRRRPLKVRLRVGFLPAHGGPSSLAFVTVEFR